MLINPRLTAGCSRGKETMNLTEIEAVYRTQARTLMGNLKTLRQYLGLTTTDLVKAAGISRNCIWSIEHCRRGVTLYTALALCTAMGVELGDLLTERRETNEDWEKYFSRRSDHFGGSSTSEG